MLKKVLFLLVLLLVVFPVFSADDEEAESDTEEEIIRTITEERIRTLKFGIDESIITLIDDLKSEENSDFNEEILEQAKIAINEDVAIAALELFVKNEDRLAEDWSLEILEDEDLYSQKMLIQAIRYLGEDMNRKSGELIESFLKHEERSIAQAAVFAIGKSEDSRYADILIELVDDSDFHEELKTTVIMALGDLGSNKAIDLLTDIVEDPDEEKGWRWRACQALGKIGNRESYDVIVNLFSDNDKVLRSYATDAIGNYDTNAAELLLMQALRDSAWEVRVKAAKHLGDRESDQAIENLIYVAEEDPELTVKREAVTALTNIADSQAMDFILKLGSTTKTPPSIWVIATEKLITDELDSFFDDAIKIINDEWEKDNSYFLNHIGKLFSQQESSKLNGVLERFLSHKEIAIKLYGIRGIGVNKIASLKERLEELTEDGQPKVIRQNALEALENF